MLLLIGNLGVDDKKAKIFFACGRLHGSIDSVFASFVPIGTKMRKSFFTNLELKARTSRGKNMFKHFSNSLLSSLVGSFNWFWSSDEDSFDRQSFTNWAEGEPNNWRGDIYHPNHIIMSIRGHGGGKGTVTPS